MEKIIVAAVADNLVIGSGGELPWDLPGDLEHFRRLTEGFPVVMGGNTYRSLPDPPLPGRKNIVLTRSGTDVNGNVEKANSLEEAWRKAAETGKDRVFVAGGESIYRQVLPEADRMVLTRIPGEFDGDSFFPEWKQDNWELVERERREKFSILNYSRHSSQSNS